MYLFWKMTFFHFSFQWFPVQQMVSCGERSFTPDEEPQPASPCPASLYLQPHLTLLNPDQAQGACRNFASSEFFTRCEAACYALLHPLQTMPGDHARYSRVAANSCYTFYSGFGIFFFLIFKKQDINKPKGVPERKSTHMQCDYSLESTITLQHVLP